MQSRKSVTLYFNAKHVSSPYYLIHIRNVLRKTEVISESMKVYHPKPIETVS
jgi:hypothetical protein